MQDWNVAPDMDVVDAEGERIGAVTRVYKHALAGGGGEASTAFDDFFEVKTGFLGLGSHYYVPLSAITDVSESAVYIDKPKDALDGLGWTVDPLKPIEEG